MSQLQSSQITLFLSSKRVTIIPFGSGIMIAKLRIMMARMSAFPGARTQQSLLKPFKSQFLPHPKLSSSSSYGPAFLLFSFSSFHACVLRFIRQKWTISKCSTVTPLWVPHGSTLALLLVETREIRLHLPNSFLRGFRAN